MDRPLDRNHPHLRLTAAIVVAGFVAILAALGGSEGTDGRSRRLDGRGLDANAFAMHGIPRTLLAMGIVSSDVDVVDHDHLGRILGHGTLHHAAAPSARATSAHATNRASRRLSLFAASPERIAFLRTTALPPPLA